MPELILDLSNRISTHLNSKTNTIYPSCQAPGMRKAGLRCVALCQLFRLLVTRPFEAVKLQIEESTFA